MSVTLRRRVKEAAKASLRRVFHAGQRAGVDVLPRHFYSEVPDINRLRNSESWRRPYTLVQIPGATDYDAQAATLSDQLSGPVAEAVSERDLHAEAASRNGEGGYGGRMDCSCLYSFVRTRQPRQIIQVGAGVSTAICIAAARDAEYRPRITCVDPYPTDFLVEAEGLGEIELIRSPVEELSSDYFGDLEAGDLYFVDSTHTLGPAGEVTRIVLEVLPRLPKGCFAHFHDIWLPYDFVPKILDGTTFFWHETALLMAYLSGNAKWRVHLSMSLLHHHRPDAVKACMPFYSPMPMDGGIRRGLGDYPCSIYLEAIG